MALSLSALFLSKKRHILNRFTLKSSRGKIWIKSSNNRNAKFAYELNVVFNRTRQRPHTHVLIKIETLESWKWHKQFETSFFFRHFFPRINVYNYFKFSMWSANSVVLVLNCQYCFVCLGVRCVLFHHLSTTFSFVICWWAGECV